MGDVKLSTTAYAVLGLLTFREFSGYDLVKEFENSVGHFMTPAKSQVYSELKKLGELGLTASKTVRQNDRPDKRMYKLTPKGKTILKEWLEGEETEPEVIKSPFLVKVFFGGHMSKEALIRQLKQHKVEAEEHLARLKIIEKHLQSNDELFFPYLTLRAGLGFVQASAKWAEDSIRKIQTREE